MEFFVGYLVILVNVINKMLLYFLLIIDVMNIWWVYFFFEKRDKEVLNS